MTSSINQVNATSTNDTSFVSSNILGLQVNAEAEITPGSVRTPYSENINVIANSLNLANQPGVTPEIAAYAVLMENSVVNLINLARNGVTQRINPNEPLSDTNPVTDYYLTKQMADSLGPVFQLLQESGATIITTTVPPQVSISAVELRRFLDLSLTTPDVANLIGVAQDAVGFAEHTFQAMIELIYIRTANEVLEASLKNLEQALQVTQDTESTLNDVLRTHNQVILTTNPPLDTNPDENDIGDWTKAYEDSLNEALAPLGIYLDPSVNIEDVIADMGEQQAALTQQLAVLEDVAGTSSDIYQRVEAVLTSLTEALDGGPEGVAAWFADGWTDLTVNPPRGSGSNANSGQIQSDINLALSSCQAFNNTQTQEVSRQLFVFEQYYTSASSMLTDLSSIIERIAQRLSGN